MKSYIIVLSFVGCFFLMLGIMYLLLIRLKFRSYVVILACVRNVCMSKFIILNKINMLFKLYLNVFKCAVRVLPCA